MEKAGLPPLWYTVFALLGGILFAFVQPYLLYGTAANPTFSFNTAFRNADIPIFLGSIILVPIMEESVFRGYILPNLEEKYDWKIALGVSSLLFSLVHLPDIQQTIITLIGGLILGIIYLKIDRLSLVILFHMGWNFAAHMF